MQFTTSISRLNKASALISRHMQVAIRTLLLRAGEKQVLVAADTLRSIQAQVRSNAEVQKASKLVTRKRERTASMPLKAY
jgi:hypothetical protein